MSLGRSVSIRDLETALPHRPPMVWLDEVLECGADGGICAVDLKPEGLYHGLNFAPVEWLAEAYGYTRACHARTASEMRGLSRAFLVGVTDYERISPIPASGRLLVEVRLTREMPPLALVSGTVKTAAGELLATAKLKLYFEY